MESSYIVYKHTAPNGKVYIGITKKEPNERWRNGHGYHCNYHFSNAIKKYGWSNIEHEILFEGLSKDEAYSLEKEMIVKYKSNQKDYGYNVSPGGDGSESVSAETRAKISNTLMGHEVSDVTRAKISQAIKGKKATEETRKKLSSIRKGKCPNKGYKWTDEQKKRHSDRAKENPIGTKSVAQIKDGVTICEFSSMSAAERATGISFKNISAVCRGKRKQAGGYTWKFTHLEI